MTRRSNIVRSEANAGEARRREFAGIVIYCAEDQGSRPSLALSAGASTDITEIAVAVPESYQRVYAAATISSIDARNSDGDFDMADIHLVAVNDTSGYENTFGYATGGGQYYTVGPSATITGVTDLAVGANRIVLRMSPVTVDGSSTFNGAGLQVILGQLVDTPGCSPSEDGGSM